MLETFGVSIGSEAVYRAMLQHPDQDLEGLALTLGRRVEEVRAALDDLADLALVDHGAPGPGGYCAIPPEQAIELLIAREEQQLEDRRARLADSRTSIPDLVQDYVSNRRRLLSSEIELLEDSRLVRSRLFQLSADATTSVCNSSPGGALPEHAVRAALRLDADVAARGVRLPDARGPVVPRRRPTGAATCRTSSGSGTRCARTRASRSCASSSTRRPP